MSDRNDDDAGYEEELPEARDPDGTLDETQPHDDDDEDPDQSAIAEEEGTGPSQHPAQPPQHAQQEEELPPEKPWTGVFEMRLPGCAGLQQIKVPNTSGIPAWLQYVLADDAFYFKYTVFPDAKHKVLIPDDAAGGQEGEEGEDGAAAPPPPPAEDPAAGDEDGEGAANGSACTPNLLLYIQQARDGSFVMSTEPEDDERPVESTSPTSMANAGAGATDEEEGADDTDGGDANRTQQEGDGGADGDVDAAAAGGSPTTAANSKDMAAAKAAAAAAAATSTASVNLLSFSIDAITLTAIRCPEALHLMLGVPGVSVDKLVQWALSDPPSTEVILSATANAKAAVAAASPSSVLLKLPTDLEGIFAAVRDDTRQHMAMQQQLSAMVRNGFVPRGPLRADALLTTPDTVWLYLTMLQHVPRSVVVQWTLPLVAEGDDPVDDDTRKAKPLSYLVGAVLLDVRRRRARAAAGKPKLRTSALQAYQALMPKLFKAEQDTDTVVTRLYSNKTDGTMPLSLTLYQSDLLLLLLGTSPEDDVAPLFVDVLRLRTQHPNRAQHGDRVALWHLLYAHLHNLRPWAVDALLAQTPLDGKLFVRGGLARIEDFSSRFLFEYEGRFADAPGACPEAVSRTRLFLEQYARAFTSKFWRELSQSEATMIALERQGSAYLVCLMNAQAAYRNVAQATIQQPPLDEAAMTAVLDEVTAATKSGDQPTVLPETVFHARLMSLAVDARNYTVVRYLARHYNVVTTQAEDNGAHVSLLDDALRRQDLALLDVLVGLGVQLSHMLHHGMCSGLSLLQAPTAAELQGGCVTEGGTTDSMATTILQHWMAVEKDRVADPNHRHGLLLTLPSVYA